MKVVIATPLYPPEFGGPATYTKILEEGLPQRGIEVEVVKFSDVRHLPKFIRHYAYYRRVRRAARDADVVLALDPVSVGLPALKAAQRAAKPFIVKIVGDYAWEQGRQRFGVTASLDEFDATTESVPVRALSQVQTRVAQGAARVVVPSEYLKQVVTGWGIPADTVVRIYNAVPLGNLGTVPPAIERIPKPHIVSAGRLVPWKHFDAMIDAVAALRAQGANVSLVIIGDGPLRTQLEQYAADKLGAAGLVLGMLPHEDALAAIRDAHVFVNNSSYEGLSHLLIEAISLGVPVVATDIPGNREVIMDGADGLLIRQGDTQALGGAIARVVADPVLREQMAAQAKIASSRFSPETMLRETAALLRSL